MYFKCLIAIYIHTGNGRFVYRSADGPVCTARLFKIEDLALKYAGYVSIRELHDMNLTLL